MKRLSLMMLALLMTMVVILAGCSSSSETSGEEASSTAAEEGEIELTMWAHKGTAEDYYVELAEGFNEEYEGEISLNVELYTDGQGAYADKVNTAVASGDMPDVLELDGPFVANYVESGILQPIGEYVSEEDKNDFLPSVLQQGTYAENLYTLSPNESSVALFYHKDIFEEAGIEAPTTVEEAWTWEEFLEVSKQLTTEDRYGLDLHMDYGISEWLTYMGSVFVWSNGGRLVSEDGLTAEGYLNGPESVEALEYIQTLFDEGVVNIAPGSTDWEEKKAAMVLVGPWIIQGFDNYSDLEWGLMPFPYSEEKKSPSGTWNFGVTTGTEHPEAAYKVIEWFTRTEANIEFSERLGQPPARKSAFEEMPKYNELPLKVFKDQLFNTAQARPSTPAYPVLTKKFAEAFHAAATGEDPQEALNRATELVERELERYRK